MSKLIIIFVICCLEINLSQESKYTRDETNSLEDPRILAALGKCKTKPAPNTMKDLDVKKLMGVWYAVEATHPVQGFCNIHVFSSAQFGRIYEFGSGLEDHGGKPYNRWFYGAEFNKTKNQAIWLGKLDTNNGDHKSIGSDFVIQIIDTDYQTYSIVYSCSGYVNDIKHYSKNTKITDAGYEAMRKASGQLPIFQIDYEWCDVHPK